MTRHNHYVHECNWLSSLKIMAVVTLCCWTQPVGAENWTRFRGPNGSGIALDTVSFPATWTVEDYLWKKQLPGKGHSSPVGWENRIFVTARDAENNAITLLCLAADDGTQLWQRKFESHSYPMHAGNSYASTTPTVDGRYVYLTWSSGGEMHCVALSHQGEVKWRTELGKFVGAHGFAASPVVIEGVVCVQVDQEEEGFLVGIDASSGDIRWRAARPAGKASYATPCEVATNGGRTVVIAQSMTGGMQAVAIDNGEVVWELADLLPARCVSSPFVINGMVLGVCGGGGSGKLLVGVDPKSAKKPQVKLSLTKQIPYVPTPLAKDNWLFLWHDQGKVSCVDLNADDPAKLEWTKRIGGKFFGSPILADDKIYCLSNEGRAVVIAADREFALLGENDLGEPSFATPAVHQGKMYLRTESSLACLPSK